ncbi:hypothetical protein Dimus_006920 [Dionaea muscipula]
MNMSSTCKGTQEMSLEIKQDGRFFSRLSSKQLQETSSSMISTAPSFRVYYGGETANVPFIWESKPGTPKHHHHHHHHVDHEEEEEEEEEDPAAATIPPLTPPPSCYSSSTCTKMPIKKRRERSNFFLNLLPAKIIPKIKPIISLSSSSSSSSSPRSSSSEPAISSSAGSSWMLCRSHSRMLRKTSTGSSTMRSIVSDQLGVDHVDDDDHEEINLSSSPTSSLCFGIKMQRS